MAWLLIVGVPVSKPETRTETECARYADARLRTSEGALWFAKSAAQRRHQVYLIKYIVVSVSIYRKCVVMLRRGK